MSLSPPKDLPSFKDSFKSSIRRTIKHTSIAAVIVTVIGSYFTYQDRIDSSKQNAWNVVRTALDWSERGKWGNVGQIDAVELLTRDCDQWWIGTQLRYLLGRNCENLKSLSLMNMDFGGLQAAGGRFSYGFFACSNFAGARLVRSHLDNTKFMGATLAGADLSGADLTKSCLFLADISATIFDNNTTIDDPEILLKACVRQDGKGHRQGIDPGNNSNIQKIADQIPLCPAQEDRCALLSERNGWNCGS
jgi:hypothetical protein